MNMKSRIFLLFLIFIAALYAVNYTHKTMHMPANSTAIISIPANDTDMFECSFELMPADSRVIFRIEYPDGTVQEGMRFNLDGWERIKTEKEGNFKIYFINYHDDAKVYLTYRILAESEQDELKKDWCPMAMALMLLPLYFIFSRS